MTLRPVDVGRFKSPSLRNVEYTAPYMHDGRFAKLEDVVEHYSTGLKRHPNLDPRLIGPAVNGGGFPFSPGEKSALFLYGPSLLQAYRDAAKYVARIFKGTRPSELPIEQPTRFEMVVNMKVARALGLKIPQSVLIRADRVIE